MMASQSYQAQGTEGDQKLQAQGGTSKKIKY